MNSTIDWCEPNYAVTPYVAEFWNSISSLWMVFLGLYGAYKHKNLFNVIPCQIYSMFFLLTLVGVGSAVFHAHLTFGTQLLDELPMLLMVFNANLIIRQRFGLIPGSWRDLRYSLPCYAVGITLYVLTRIYWIFVVMFLGGVLELIYLKQLCRHSSLSRRLTNVFLGSAGIAGMFWVADHLLCMTMGHLLLHAVWHLIAGFATYVGCLSLVELCVFNGSLQLQGTLVESFVPHLQYKYLRHAPEGV